MTVRAIRGAITVEDNNKDEILAATKIMLNEIVEANNLDKNDIINVIFTVTKDLDAVFPAVAARQLGWNDIALTCLNEMDVKGSLEKCIRVLIFFNTDKKNSDINYVYLNKAKALRADL